MTTTSMELSLKYRTRGVKVDFGSEAICFFMALDDPREGYDTWTMLVKGVEFKLTWAPNNVNGEVRNHFSYLAPNEDGNESIPTWARVSLKYDGLINAKAACRIICDIETVYSRAYKLGRADLKKSFAGLMGLIPSEGRTS